MPIIDVTAPHGGMLGWARTRRWPSRGRCRGASGHDVEGISSRRSTDTECHVCVTEGRGYSHRCVVGVGRGHVSDRLHARRSCARSALDGSGMSRTVLAYVDETGDTGDVATKGATSCYGLGCVLVDVSAWPAAYDGTVELRRRLRERFDLPVRAEVKANYLVRSGGPIRPLGLAPAERRLIYRAHMRHLATIDAQAFAVVVDKTRANVNGRDCLYMAWETLLQRLESLSRYEDADIIVIHDAGENDEIRKYFRKARRFLTAGRASGGGRFQFSARRFIDDPVPRDSASSYFVQIADLVAYAGWRTYQAPGRSAALVVDRLTWDDLGVANRTVVNSVRLNGSVPGVVLRTR